MLFKYTTPKNSKSMGHCATPLKALNYCLKKAIDSDTFNMLSGYNAKPSELNREFKELQKLNGKCSGKNQRKYYEFIASPKEKIPKDPEKRKEMEKNLMNYGRELLNKKFKNCQAVLVLHDDGGNGYNLHFLINPVKTDLKKLDIKRKDYDDIKTFASDELSKKYGFEAMTKEMRKKKSPKKLSNKDLQSIKKGQPTEKARIIETIDKIKEKGYSGQEDFINKAKEQGITITIYINDNKKEQFRYATDKYPKGFSGASLGENYEKATIEKEYNKAPIKPLSRKEELEEQIKNFKIRRDPDGTANVKDIMAKAELQTELDSLKIQENNVLKAREKYNKEVKECDDTKKLIIDKIDKIDDKNLKWYNDKYGTNYTKQWFKNEAQRIYDKNLPPSSILGELNGLLNIVFKIINSIINYIKAQERANNNGRGGM